MGGKILWTGLTVMLALPKFLPGMTVEVVGAIIMIIGCVLLLLDR